ncbi:cytochrome P450 [Nonomuraea muscovyensis]|uniref:Cytochrome P450 n=1 Tax=Nonomuraea muscovyensis TaxID=1124761 RepID=A0A7X0C3F8_9ACTN|nr:cytochrome P450 [Nonomuraea muscovyensis]MBB6347799.1 cytochrome P450 [Nonomuraea muscovyensis]
MSRPPGVLPPRFDPLDPEVIADPYPFYARLRQAGPVCRAGVGTWMVLRYADVSALLNDKRLGNRRAGEDGSTPLFGAGPSGTLSQRIIAGREGPDHVTLRGLLTRSLAAARSRGWRPRVEELVDELLEPGLDGAPFDVVADLAFPLQARIVCELLGLPPAERERIWPAAVDLGRAFIPYRLPTPEAAAAADRAVAHLRECVSGWFDERARDPRDDLISHLASGLGRDGLDRADLVDNLVFLLFAGFEPTMNMVANGLSALLAHPGEQARLAADPSLTSTAVEEFLRYDAPTQYTMRIVREPIELGGRVLRPGRLLLLVLGSANRDERRFAEPDRLDVSRHPNPHVSFGGGAHHCTGWALARVEGEAVVARVLSRCAAIEPAGPAVRLDHPNFRAHESLPVRLRAA